MAVANSLYWHDYETWGANPATDKPCQFAGVRTDEDLNIIGDPLMLYCQPGSDCLPHPQACLITGITPQLAQSQGVIEPEFFARIYEELAQPGTCGVGYNSIRFDDEVTRYGLFRNFYDPYEREWRYGNSRWDIIDMVRFTYALRPEGIEWPRHDDGSPSFKLEALSAANGLAHDNAHDALSDVYATIALARLIRQQQPGLYDYAYQLRDKRRAAAMVDVSQRKPLLHISSRFPARHGCAALVVPLLQHPSNRNSIICYDLAVDPRPLLTLTADTIVERLYSRQEQLPAGVERIPLKEIHLNKAPIIATPKLLDQDTAKRLGIDKARCESHWLQLLHADLDPVLTEVYSRNPFPPNSDPEQQLYEGFSPDQDRQLFSQLRTAQPQELGQFFEQFTDKRLQALLFRYRARHYPQTLTSDERQRWQQWRYQRLTDPAAGASVTLDAYFEILESLAGNGHNQRLIDELLAYGDEVLAEES